MKGQLQLYYDEEGDFLEINIGEGIAERIDEKTGKVTGISILSFKKRTKELKDLKINLPVNLEISA